MNFLTSLMELTTSTFVRSFFETEQSDQTVLSGSIYFLGKSYLLPIQKTQFEKDVITRFWFTYRQGFEPIGDSGPSTDQGWGCMLRCGQMMMAHALVCRHLGRDWIWDYKLNPVSLPSTHALIHLQTYHSILRSFSDKRDSCYSVHQLTSIGSADGKCIGEWYGPNTIAHVLKKASSNDGWGGVVVHVCMDNTVILNDILERCKETDNKSDFKNDVANENSGDNNTKYNNINLGNNDNKNENINGNHDNPPPWKPLLLIIPLRLGVTEMNKAYYEPLKTFFELKQTAGVLGGRPNNAYWFVGYSGDYLLYFDPHTVQPISDERANMHSSYHITCPSRVHVSHLDPSIAAAFFCNSEEDFKDLVSNFQSRILAGSKTPVFEVHTSRPTQHSVFTTLVNSNISYSSSSTDGSCGSVDGGDGSNKQGNHPKHHSKSSLDRPSNDSDFELVNYEEEFEIIE